MVLFLWETADSCLVKVVQSLAPVLRAQKALSWHSSVAPLPVSWGIAHESVRRVRTARAASQWSLLPAYSPPGRQALGSHMIMRMLVY